MSELQRYDNKREELDEDVIELLPLLKALWRSAWLVVVAALVFGSVTYVATKVFVTPTYRTSFTVYVNNRSNSEESTTVVSSSDLTASQSLVYTYSTIMTSRSVLEAAAAQAGIDSAYETLSEEVSIETVSSTEIMQVYCTMEDPAEALAMAQAIAAVAPDYIAQIVEGSSMQIIDNPVLPTDIYSPSYLKNTLIGMFVGAFLVAAAIVLREFLDDRIKEEGELEKRFGIAIVGVIPNMLEASKTDHSYGYGYGHASGKGSARQ